MQPVQAFKLEQIQQRLEMSDGTMWDLARRISHNEGLVSFADLSMGECDELIGFLELYERDRQAEKFARELALA